MTHGPPTAAADSPCQDGTPEDALRTSAPDHANADPDGFGTADIAVSEIAPADIAVSPAVPRGLEAANAAVWTITLDPRPTIEIAGAPTAFQRLNGRMALAAFMAANVHASGRLTLDETLGSARPFARIDIALSLLLGLRYAPMRLIGAWDADGRTASGLAIPAGQGEILGDQGFDTVTGLLNRPTFRSALATLAEGGGVVALVNVDRFRRWNETLGHDAADAAIAVLGRRLVEAGGPRALGARVGPDELALFVRRADPLVLQAALDETMPRRFRLRGVEIQPQLTVAVVAIDTEAGTDPLLEAELAVEQARSERPSTGLHSFAAPTGPNRLALEADLVRGLRAGEFEPFFQPVVDLDSGRITGFEALSRWRHPTRGVLAPIAFLGLAAEIGMLGDIGRMTMGRAVRQLAQWRERTGRMLSVSVNLTSAELDRADLLEDVAEAIHTASLPPGALELEITEDQIMRDPARVARTLSLLRAAGAGVALDDFGVGFSSLAWLAQLPADRIKLDRFFVRTAAQGGAATRIVHAVSGLARDLGMTVVAEGIEDEPTRVLMAGLGCTHGQGYLWGAPQEARAADAMIQPRADAPGARTAAPGDAGADIIPLIRTAG